MVGSAVYRKISTTSSHSSSDFIGIVMQDSSSSSRSTTPTPTTTTTTTEATSCWKWTRRRVDVDERVDNLELLDATKKNNHKKCESILEEGKTNVNTRERDTKRTALHYAATSSKCKILKLLLDHKADCNIQDRDGNTPLLLAIKNCKQEYERKRKHQQNALLHHAENNGDFQDTVDKLLDHNADCNVSDNSGNTPLHLAACNGFQTTVAKLLKKQADCMTINSNEDTPLHLAATEGHHNCCEKLLQKQDKIDAKNKDKNTPLHLAAKKGHLKVVELLKGRGASCSEQNSLGETPLHLAATEGHLDCFRVIQNDENINSRKTGGYTPLHCAANKGNAEIVAQLLLVSGVDCKDKDGNTPLHLAVTMGHLSCCKELLVACTIVDVNSQNKKKEASLHLAASQGRRDVCALLLNRQNIDINIKNKSKQTPLHLAAKHSNDDVVELLLSHEKSRADCKLMDKHGYMPLHYAAENGAEKSCQHLVKKVINEYMKDNKPIKLALRNRQTPLMLAAMKGHYRCCETLLFKDIDAKDKEGNIPHFKDIDAKDQDGNTALLYAAKGGFKKTVEFLIDNGASTNVVNNDENTVLHQAAKAKADDCLQYLLNRPGDKDINAKEAKNGFTPLHEAINNEALTCAKILLDHGASASEKCKKYGRTPLHLAAKQGDPGLCSLLSKDKENVNMEDKNNQTPLHVAAEHGCRDVCKVLLSTKGIQVLAKDKNRRTALHLAAQKGHERVLKLLTKKGVFHSEPDEEGSTALHLAAKNGDLKCCEILLSTSRNLIDQVDDKKKFPVDVAFEERKDKVFAYLMKNFKPPREEDTTKQPWKQWPSQLHKYMHQSLQEGEPRVVAAEAIIESDWWKAAFFTQDNGSTGQSNQYYCANFQELIISHPNLALKAQNRCITDDGVKHDFRLFKDNTCLAEDNKKPAQGPALTSTQRFLEEHPLSLMVQNTRKELLQHPLIKAWLTHLWKTFLFYIFIFLLIIEILFLASLNAFMASTDNWTRVEYKCNSTREQLCGFKVHLSPNVPEGSLNKSTAEETSRMLPNDELGDLSQCENILSSNFGMWIFLLVMTGIIVALEGKYWWRLRQKYFKPKRYLRFLQVFFTVILLLPIGTCDFQPQMWIWTTWQWHCGIIGLLLEWLRFINMLNQLPLLFVFMPITKNFFWNYMKALGYILLLLFAFSHIFHLLLANQAAFESWPQSMMKMIVWLLGDLNYDDAFVDGTLIYPHMGKLVFVVFIIVVGGYIANLAITQPSERVDEFRKGAAYFQMESQSTLFLETRACFPELWELSEKWLGSKKTYLNELSSGLVEKMMNVNITSEKNLPEENPLQDLKHQVDTLMNLCTEQSEEIKDLKDKLDILLRRIPESLPQTAGENTRDSSV